MVPIVRLRESPAQMEGYLERWLILSAEGPQLLSISMESRI